MPRAKKGLHASEHENDGIDEIDLSGLNGQQIIVPYNDKIADITHADTNKHFLDLAAALSETRKIISIKVAHKRIAGTGKIYFYPNEGTDLVITSSGDASTDRNVIIADGTNRIQYRLFVANDDFDLYFYGYVVET